MVPDGSFENENNIRVRYRISMFDRLRHFRGPAISIATMVVRDTRHDCGHWSRGSTCISLRATPFKELGSHTTAIAPSPTRMER